MAGGVWQRGLPIAALVQGASDAALNRVMLAASAAVVILALPAGVLIDRGDRRWLMFAAGVAAAVVVGALAWCVAAHVGRLAVVTLVGVCVAVVDMVYQTSATTLVPQLVRGDRLPWANAGLYAAGSGFTLAVLGAQSFPAALPVVLCAVLIWWMLAAAALAGIRGRYRQPASRRQAVAADLAAGVRLLWRHRQLRAFAAMQGVLAFAGSCALTATLTYAGAAQAGMRLLSLDPSAVNLLAVAAGAILGALIAVPVTRGFGRGPALAVALVAYAAAIAMSAATVGLAVAAAAGALAGTAVAIVSITLVTLRQQLTPAPLLGRVNSCFVLITQVGVLLGGPAAGAMTRLLGARTTIVLTGLFALTAVTGLRMVTGDIIDSTGTAIPAQTAQASLTTTTTGSYDAQDSHP